MKKIIYSILCLSMIISSFNCITIHAENERIIEENSADISAIDESEYEEIDINLLDYSINSSDQVNISDCDTSVSGKIIIPETIEGYPVVKINEAAFQDCENLEGIILSTNMKTIDRRAFTGCTNLKEVTIPKGVTSIGSSAFSGCTSLEYVSLPTGLKTIDSSAFYNCTSLKNITLRTGLKTLGSGAFSDCTNLKKITLPKGLTTLGDSVFAGCTNLEKVTINEGITIIEKETFLDCENLKEVTLPEGITSIEEKAFKNNGVLEEIVLPSTLENIGNYAFSSCIKLKSIMLPEGLMSIGDYAFYRCFRISSLEIPSSVTEIGKEIHSVSPFVIGCYKGSTAEEYVTTNNYQYYYIDGSEEENTLSDKVDDNFTWSINKATGKMIIHCDGDMPNFTQSTIPWKSNQICIRDVEITGNCTSIGNYMFYGCKKMENITIPDTVISIGEYAFSNSINLETIDLPDNLTEIKFAAFSGCTSLKEIVIPDSVTVLGEKVFYTCYELENVTLPKNLKVIDIYTFGSCYKLTSIDIPNSVITIKEVAFQNTDLREVEIPYSVKSIERNAFAGLSNIEKLVVYNPNCTLDGIFTSSNKNAIIYGYKGSTIEEFANINGLTFKEIETYNVDKMNLDIKLSYTKTTYNGNKKTPKVTIKDINGYQLVRGEDYVLKYSNNVDAGKASIKITFKGNYTGTITKTFKITAKDASDFDASLSYTKATYNGKKKSPTVTVVDANGNELVNEEDYTIKYGNATRTNVGRYSVTITFKGNYKGTKKLWFTIVPKAPATVNAELYGYDDVKVSWSESTGASGYYVYYKKSSASSYTLLGTTTKLYYKKANLSDGVKYTFKVVPYYESSSGTKYKALKSKTDTIYTLKKLSAPEITKYSSTKVKVSWDNISGESGYQISRSSSSTGTYIVSTYATDSASYKNIKATSGKVYYYKVRAYVEYEDGTRVYGPWSKVTKYTLK